VLFIDDIPLRKPNVVGNLCQAMKDFELDLIIEEGSGERSVKIDLATTPSFLDLNQSIISCLAGISFLKSEKEEIVQCIVVS